MARRLIRIVPLYWLVTALYLGIIQVSPGLASNYSAADIARSFFFIPTVRPDSPDVQPIVGQGWSLNYEMLFYVLFALALLVSRGSALALLSVAFVGFVLTHYTFDLGTPLHFWTTPIIMEFLAGVLIGMAARSGFSVPKWAGAIITLVGAWLFFSPGMPSITDENRLFVWGVPAAMVVGGLTLGKVEPRLGQNTFITLGDASYALYLIHPLCIRTLLLAAGRAGIDAGPLAWPLLVATVCAATVASVFVHRLVERPATRWLRSAYESLRRCRVPA
ncbi:acyltransferase [Mesorhizobium sp. L-8-3]|nr:acyltransferase [Mesorhizobium sp. L-8-3]